MNKTAIIIRREFSTRVKKKSFLIITILTPFLIAALIFVPLWLASIESDEQQTVVVIDQTGHYMSAFHDTQSFHFVSAYRMDNSYKSDTSDVKAVLVITSDLRKNPHAATIYSRQEVQSQMRDCIQDVLNEQVRKDKIRDLGIKDGDKIIADIEKSLTVQTVKWNDNGEETSSSTDVAIGAAFLLTFLIYVFVMSYGGMVMSSVMEEKSNRIVELMVSSVKPFQLMLGKIIGVALVGLFQLAIWGLLLAGILTACSLVFGNVDAGELAAAQNAVSMGQTLPQPADQTGGLLPALLNLPFAELTIMFLLFFIGGYLLYASIFAAIGASVNAQEDSSQFMTPIIIVLIFALYAAIYSIENVDGPLALWTSLIPFTSPIVMMVRIPFGVPLWQEIVSLVLLFATAIAFVWVSGKIYRVGILMYGKKPTFKDIIKWLGFK